MAQRKEITIIKQPRVTTKAELKTLFDDLRSVGVIDDYHFDAFIANDTTPIVRPTIVQMVLREIVQQVYAAGGSISLIRLDQQDGAKIVMQFDSPIALSNNDNSDRVMIASNTNVTAGGVSVTLPINRKRTVMGSVESAHLQLIYTWLERIHEMYMFISTATYKSKPLQQTTKPTANPPSKLLAKPPRTTKLTEITKHLSAAARAVLPEGRTQILMEIWGYGIWALYRAMRLEQIAKSRVIQDEIEARWIGVDIENKARNAIVTETKHIAGLRRIAQNAKLDLKNPKQRETAETMLKNRMEYEDLILKSGGKCEHFKLVRRKRWRELAKIVELPAKASLLDANVMFPCKKCGLPAMCPHTYFVSEHMQRKELIKQFAGHGSSGGAYYCKVCGEKLFAIIEELTVATEAPKLAADDEMGSRIWREVRNTISAAVKFTVPVDMSRLTSSIADTIRPPVDAEYARILKSKTSTINQALDTAMLYTCIYTYAYMVKIMLANNDIVFRRRAATTGGAEAHPASIKKLQELIKTALLLIIETKASLIQAIPHMTNEAVRELFKQAYRFVSPTAIKTETFEYELPPSTIVNSTVYAYMWYGKQFEMLNKTGKRLKYTDAKTVMGATVDELAAMKGNILQKATLPQQWGFKANDAYAKYAYDSFIAFMEYASTGTPPPKLTDPLARAQPIAYVARKVDLTEFVPSPIPLSEIYCKSGKHHKWSTFIYKSASPKAKELELTAKTIPEYSSGAARKEWLSMRMIDFKCELCGMRRSESHTIKDTAIAAAIDENTRVQSFYNLYQFRCPIKNIHQWIADVNEYCTQCSLTKTQLAAHDLEYFHKYESAFRRDTMQSIAAATGQPDNDLKSLKSLDIKTANFPEWKHKEPAFHQIAQLSGAPIAVINNVGAIPGSQFSKVEDGSLIPSVTIDPLIRAARIHEYITHMLIEMEMLRNGAISADSDEDGKNTSKLETYKVAAAAALQMRLLQDYQHQYLHYLRVLPHSQLLNWCLNTLFDALLALAAAKHEEYARHVISTILRTEYMQSDPGALKGRAAEMATRIDISMGDTDSWDAVVDENSSSPETAGDIDPFSYESSGIDTEQLYEQRDSD